MIAGASGKPIDRFCAEIGVAKLPPVTEWSGMPLPTICRVDAVQLHVAWLVALTFGLAFGVFSL